MIPLPILRKCPSFFYAFNLQIHHTKLLLDQNFTPDCKRLAESILLPKNLKKFEPRCKENIATTTSPCDLAEKVAISKNANLPTQCPQGKLAASSCNWCDQKLLTETNSKENTTSVICEDYCKQNELSKPSTLSMKCQEGSSIDVQNEVTCQKKCHENATTEKKTEPLMFPFLEQFYKAFEAEISKINNTATTPKQTDSKTEFSDQSCDILAKKILGLKTVETEEPESTKDKLDEKDGPRDIAEGILKSYPQAPTTCCMSACPNCVWLKYAEDVANYFKDGGERAIKEIQEKVEDDNIKAFLLHEIRMKLKNKK